MKEWYYTTSDDIDKKYYMYIDTELLKKMFRIIMYIAMTS